jgi:hypothetical protein
MAVLIWCRVCTVYYEQNPVHFVGHSAGVQVVRVLHQMLADKVHKQEIFRFYSQVIVVYCYRWN